MLGVGYIHSIFAIFSCPTLLLHGILYHKHITIVYLDRVIMRKIIFPLPDPVVHTQQYKYIHTITTLRNHRRPPKCGTGASSAQGSLKQVQLTSILGNKFASWQFHLYQMSASLKFTFFLTTTKRFQNLYKRKYRYIDNIYISFYTY